MIDINWRPYQVECKKSIKENYDQGITRQLIVQGTGTGKRLAAVALMPHFRRSLFIAHREELIMQAYNEIQNYFPMEVGIIKGPVFEIDKRVVVASVQTLYNRLDRIDPDTFQFVALDEVHHFMSRTFCAVARHFTPKLLTGWTATPKRLDGLSLSNLFEKLVFQYDIKDGIKDGFLAQVEAYQIKTVTDISKVKKTAGDFNQKQLSEAVDSALRNNLIVQKYKQYTPGRQGIAYCVDMDHAYHLRDEFRTNGIKCETVVSDKERCPNRSYLLDRFKGGDIDVMTNVEILCEGYDYNDVGVVIMARPTQSETLYKQCIGRSTRLKSAEFIEKHGTGKAVILDFVDNTGKLCLINAFELEKDIPIEDRMFLPAEHKEKLLFEEKKRRERKIAQEAGKDRKVDILTLPKVQVWNGAKMLEPATEKQIQWIRSAGIYEEGIEYTKLQASELISNLPCQEWQIRYLAIHGYDVSKGASVGQYQKVKSSIDNKHKFATLDRNGQPVTKITDTWEE